MPSFLKDISKFYGTGERNREGQTLEGFLEAYDPYRYETPSCTTDAVIFAYSGERFISVSGLRVLMVRRSNHPSIGYWALPGGFIELREHLEDTARRELFEETGVEGLVMEQLGTYGDYDRDPRARVITTAYLALVREDQVKVRAGDDAADAAWCRFSLERTEEARKEGAAETENAEEAEKAEKTEETEEAEKTEETAEAEKTEEAEKAEETAEKVRQKTVRSLYRLTVENEEKNLHTEALVEETVTESWPIRKRSYRVVSQGEIAVDHAAMIVEAALKLERRI